MKQECNHGLKLLTDGTCPLCIAEAMPHYYIPLQGSCTSQPIIGLMTRYGKVTLPDPERYYSKINTDNDGEIK